MSDTKAKQEVPRLLLKIKKALTANFTSEVGEAFIEYVIDEYEGDTMLEDCKDDLSEETWEDSQLVDGLKETVSSDLSPEDLQRAFEIMRRAIGIKLAVQVVDPRNFNNSISPEKQKAAENYLCDKLPTYAYDRRDFLRVAGLLKCLGEQNHIQSLPVLLWDTYSVYRCENVKAPNLAVIEAETICDNFQYYKNVKYKEEIKYLMSYWIEPKGLAPKMQFTPMTLNADSKKLYAHYSFAINKVIHRIFNEYGDADMMVDENVESNTNHLTPDLKKRRARNGNTGKWKAYPLQLDVWIIPSHCRQRTQSGGFDFDSDDESDEDLNSYFNRKKKRRDSEIDSSSDDDDCGSEDDDTEHVYGNHNVPRKNEYLTVKHVFEDDIFGIRKRLNFHDIPFGDDVIDIRKCSFSNRDIDKTADQILRALEKCAKKNGHDGGTMFSMKRYIIIIDRRVSGWDDLFSDQLLVFHPQFEKNGNHGVISDPYTEEQLLQKTKNCILPSMPAVQMFRHYGAYQDFAGHQHLMSYHIHNPELIRCWWYTNGSITRWFPRYMSTVWPKFFTNDNDDDLVSEEVIKAKIAYPYLDETFDAWYAITINGENRPGVPVECIGTKDCYYA